MGYGERATGTSRRCCCPCEGAAVSLDDAATQTIKASAKAAGVVIDDAAVTPRYVVGFAAERELPITGRIARGSLKSKILFLLPAALLLSAFTPWAITPLLMIGGLFLCFEGYEKVQQMMAPHNAHANATYPALPALDARARKRQWPAPSELILFSRLRSWRLLWPASRLHTF
jgi:predicted DNA repair protein MutK